MGEDSVCLCFNYILLLERLGQHLFTWSTIYPLEFNFFNLWVYSGITLLAEWVGRVDNVRSMPQAWESTTGKGICEGSSYHYKACQTWLMGNFSRVKGFSQCIICHGVQIKHQKCTTKWLIMVSFPATNFTGSLVVASLSKQGEGRNRAKVVVGRKKPLPVYCQFSNTVSLIGFRLPKICKWVTALPYIFHEDLTSMSVAL